MKVCSFQFVYDNIYGMLPFMIQTIIKTLYYIFTHVNVFVK